MQKIFYLASFAFLLFASLSLIHFSIVAADEIMEVEADIYVDQPFVQIEVPEYVYIGNVTVGFQTKYVKISINNTGNVNVSVTPELVFANDPIFKYIYMTKRGPSTQSNYKRIGDFSFSIDKPSSLGSIEKDYFYMMLDLKNITDTIHSDIVGYTTNVKFIAVAQ